MSLYGKLKRQIPDLYEFGSSNYLPYWIKVGPSDLCV